MQQHAQMWDVKLWINNALVSGGHDWIQDMFIQTNRIILYVSHLLLRLISHIALWLFCPVLVPFDKLAKMLQSPLPHSGCSSEILELRPGRWWGWTGCPPREYSQHHMIYSTMAEPSSPPQTYTHTQWANINKANNPLCHSNYYGSPRLDPSRINHPPPPPPHTHTLFKCWSKPLIDRRLANFSFSHGRVFAPGCSLKMYVRMCV